MDSSHGDGNCLDGIIRAKWRKCRGFCTRARLSRRADRWTYADVADLFLDAPVVLTARVSEAIALKQAAATPPRAGTVRYYIMADVVTLIRGSGGVSPRLTWLVDVPLDARGKAPKLKKAMVILAARPVPGRAGEVQLTARDAMVPWGAAFEGRVRTVLAEGLALGAPPSITGVASAFHSKGTLPGEGETQIFLATADNRPVSINVLRRPEQEPSWSVAFSEIVDEAARPPARDTLAWYRLACALPAEMPAKAVGELSEEDAAAARLDYGFVLSALGRCDRTRG